VLILFLLSLLLRLFLQYISAKSLGCSWVYGDKANELFRLFHKRLDEVQKIYAAITEIWLIGHLIISQNLWMITGTGLT
jgi:hypothetical protein